MICFWKAFAWITFGWALTALRGKGILIRRDPKNPRPQKKSGPGWRLVSSKTYGVPDPEPSASEAGDEVEAAAGVETEVPVEEEEEAAVEEPVAPPEPDR
ncbi:MAG: hypothetical protein AAGD06_29220 [Acidobacteriota bacterium]